MIKNIMIIGCGNMGFAHLSSFLKLNKSFKIYLIDNDIKKIKKIKKKIKNTFFYTKSDLTFLKKIPFNMKIDFAVVASHVYQRFEITRNLLKHNKVIVLFLEKFLFYKSHHYSVIEKLLKKKGTQAFVNVWSSIFLKTIKLHKINYNNGLSSILIRKERLLTNLIHYYFLLELVSNDEIFIDFTNSKIIKKKFSKLTFDEARGKIVFKNRSRQIAEIKSNFLNNNDIWKFKSENIDFHLEINGGNILVKSKNKLKKYKFPFSSQTTAAFFNKIIKNPKILKSDFPRFNAISHISKKILKEGRKTFKKDLIIR